MPAREREREKPTPTCQCSVQFLQVFFLFIFNLPASFTNNKLQSDILLAMCCSWDGERVRSIESNARVDVWHLICNLFMG